MVGLRKLETDAINQSRGDSYPRKGDFMEGFEGFNENDYIKLDFHNEVLLLTPEQYEAMINNFLCSNFVLFQKK